MKYLDLRHYFGLFIDLCIIIFFIYLFRIVQGFNFESSSILHISRSITIIIPFPYVLYCSIFHSSHFQATVGEYIMGIKIVDLDGNKISFGKAVNYNISRFLATLCMVVGLVFTSIFFLELEIFEHWHHNRTFIIGLVLFLFGVFALFYLGKVLKVGRMLRNSH